MAVRSWLLCVAACAITSAWAQSYPVKPVRWVVPSTPGDGSDITGRLIAERISRELGQPVVIDNKPGAGGVLGSDAVAKAAPDGYTMIVGNAGSHGVNAGIYAKLPYDVVKDFVPVAMICTAPNVMVVSPGVKAASVGEFIAYAKANPGKVNYASGGVGSSAHLSAELFKSLTGVDMTHIPYKGSAPAVAGVLGGESQVMIGNLPPWSAQIKAGKVQALAVTTAKRHHSLPDVPALAEVLPGFETVAWFGVLAPAGTPAAVIERMNIVINQALEQPEVKARLATLSCDPAPATPQAFAARVSGDVARWKKLAAEKNIRAD
ncbi:MAG: tripartite tricarboxylate transporter substrate binding protein [Comamonadaceae bacterium]|nr:tripartite tricarboxylate transporter substrate binding protein [Comamonadaceae bacterium]